MYKSMNMTLIIYSFTAADEKSKTQSLRDSQEKWCRKHEFPSKSGARSWHVYEYVFLVSHAKQRAGPVEGYYLQTAFSFKRLRKKMFFCLKTNFLGQL